MSAFSRRRVAETVVDRLETLPREQVLRELAAYLIEERQVKQLPQLMEEIESEFAQRGHVVADVTTAHALDEMTRNHLSEYIKQLTHAQDIELRETTDESLIGGVVIETPGHYFDSSIKTQLKRLKVNSH